MADTGIFDVGLSVGRAVTAWVDDSSAPLGYGRGLIDEGQLDRVAYLSWERASDDIDDWEAAESDRVDELEVDWEAEREFTGDGWRIVPDVCPDIWVNGVPLEEWLGGESEDTESPVLLRRDLLRRIIVLGRRRTTPAQRFYAWWSAFDEAQFAIELDAAYPDGVHLKAHRLAIFRAIPTQIEGYGYRQDDNHWGHRAEYSCLKPAEVDRIAARRDARQQAVRDWQQQQHDQIDAWLDALPSSSYQPMDDDYEDDGFEALVAYLHDDPDWFAMPAPQLPEPCPGSDRLANKGRCTRCTRRWRSVRMTDLMPLHFLAA